MKETIYYIPFYNIYSKALHEILGVEDMRSVRKRIENIGVKIYGTGKDSYIICEDVIQVLRNAEKMQHTTYEAQGMYAYKVKGKYSV